MTRKQVIKYLNRTNMWPLTKCDAKALSSIDKMPQDSSSWPIKHKQSH